MFYCLYYNCVGFLHSDNDKSSGNHEFIDQMAGGFDEGEGSRNVSDNINKDNYLAGTL